MDKPNLQQRHQSTRGVTLMELMIVLVMVGILRLIGCPAYVDYSTRARRADGKALLMDAAARMERFYFDNNGYTTDRVAGLGYALVGGTVESADRNYVLPAPTACTGGTIATFYVLTAQPNSTKPFSDDDCGNLTLDSRGTRGRSGTGASVEDCWGR